MRKCTNIKENAISAGPHLQKWHYSLAHTLPLALGSAHSSLVVNAPTFGWTLFAEAGLRRLAFFLQVLRRQEQGEHELSYSEHVCAWVIVVGRSHLRIIRIKANAIRHKTKKTILYMHQASKPLHYTPQRPWRLFRDSAMHGLHLAKPHGTNTTPFPKKLPRCRRPQGPGRWSSWTSTGRAS